MWLAGWMDVWMNEWIDGGWVSEWEKGGWTGRWVDGWPGNWVDEYSLRGKEEGDEPLPHLCPHIGQWLGREIIYCSFDLILFSL